MNWIFTIHKKSESINRIFNIIFGFYPYIKIRFGFFMHVVLTSNLWTSGIQYEPKRSWLYWDRVQKNPYCACLNFSFRKNIVKIVPNLDLSYKVLILSIYVDFNEIVRLMDNIFTAFASLCCLSACMCTVTNKIIGLFRKSFMRDHPLCQALCLWSKQLGT